MMHEHMAQGKGQHNGTLTFPLWNPPGDVKPQLNYFRGSQTMVSAGIYQISAEEHAANPKVSRDYEGVVPHRRTTDVLFLLLIWGMWAGMTAVGYQGLTTGDPYRLVGPIAYNGDVCGFQGSEYASHKYLYTVTEEGLGVCVSSCPSSDAPLNSTNPEDYYCFDQVSSDPSQRSDYIANNCMTNGEYTIGLTLCLCNIRRSTVDIFKRCVFSDSSVRSSYINQDVPSYIQNFAADIYTARNVIFGFGFGLAVFLSFLWTYLLEIRWLGYILVYTGLFGSLVVMIATTALAEHTVQVWNRQDPRIHSHEETLALQIFGWILLGAAILYFCMIVFLYKDINLSIQILGLTSECILSMKAIIFVPIVNLIAFAVFLVPCIMYLFYCASDISSSDLIVGGVVIGKTYHTAPGVIDRLWYLFFCLLWTMNWIGGMSAIAIAIACALWYFRGEGKHVNSCTIFKAYGLTIRYHWGTAAFGSLLIAVVQFVRWFLLYVQKHFGNISQSNCILKFVAGIVNCCLWCLEKCLKFISKNAYIQTAIHVSYKTLLLGSHFV